MTRDAKFYLLTGRDGGPAVKISGHVPVAVAATVAIVVTVVVLMTVVVVAVVVVVHVSPSGTITAT